MTTATIEGYIRDLSAAAIHSCGSVYCNNLVQVIAEEEGADFTLEHSFYAINSEGVYRKLGGLSFTEEGGEIGMSFDLTNSEGVTEPILGLSSSGLEITGGSASFETTSIEVSDIDITLGSGALLPTDIDQGGINLGTIDSGIISILYSTADGFWTTNTGFNVQTGHAFTVNTDTVVLDESGLKIDDIVLSQTGLQIGIVDPVILDSSGLSVGSDLSLNTSTGLTAGDITLNSTDGLLIGSEVSVTSSAITLGTVDPVILDSSGLSVGSNLSLNTSSGLTAGDITLNSADGLLIGSDLTLDSTGLFIGDAQFSVANGIVFDDVTLTNTALTYTGTTGGDVILNEEGIYIGTDISLTKTGGLEMVGGVVTESVTIGVSPDETVLDDTSLQLGTDLLVNHDGLYLNNTDAAIYLGDTQQWKIVFDPATENLKFQYYDTTTSAYVTKTEMKST